MTNIFKTAFLLLSVMAFFSCGQNEVKKQKDLNVGLQIEKKDSTLKQSILVDTFSTFPPGIDGCACYFSNSKEEFKNKSYVYVDNYQDTAFVCINGLMTKFKLVDSKEISEKHLIKRFDNDDFELIIDIKEIGQLDETWQQKGSLKLTRKGGKTIIKKIYGECGC